MNSVFLWRWISSLFLFGCCKWLKTLSPIFCCLFENPYLCSRQANFSPLRHVWRERRKLFLNGDDLLLLGKLANYYPFDYLLKCYCLIKQTFNQTLTERQILKTKGHKIPNETKVTLWIWLATFNGSLIFFQPPQP